MPYKTCTRCGEQKPESDYYINRCKGRKTRYRPECKECAIVLEVKEEANG